MEEITFSPIRKNFYINIFENTYTKIEQNQMSLNQIVNDLVLISE